MPQLDRRGLPHPRQVQKRVDKNALLDPIGEHFQEKTNISKSVRLRRRRIPKVINDIVKFCYDEFTAIVA